MDLRGIFLALQDRMIGTLGAHHAALENTVAKGTANEVQWLAMLGKYLPERYCVTQGFVLDSRGSVSEQMDIIIYDRHYSPLLFDEDGQRNVPAESVYAVLEVKTSFQAQELAYASDKVASVRRLHRTSVPIRHAGGRFKAKAPPRILGGVLALTSRWDPPLGKPFCQLLSSLKPDARLDLGCVLRAGGFEVNYPKRGPAKVHCGTPETALVFFFRQVAGAAPGHGHGPGGGL